MSYAEWWWSQTASGPDPDAGDPIGQSLRFKGGGGVKLQRSSFPAVSTNDATINFWWKHAFNNNTGTGFLAITQPGVDIRFYGGGTMSDGRTYASGTPWRDPSAWYNFHLVYSYDTHRYKVYSNGVEIWDIAAFWTKTQGFMGGGAFTIGELDASNYKAPMYLASYHVVDGQALDPTTFGRYNANGVWVPVDPKKDGDTAWYGANGFHLTFADPADIGRDQSGNGNDFTATGFETTDQTSPLYDIMQDSPTQNYATLNPNILNASKTINANLSVNVNNPNYAHPQTIGFPETGQWMAEYTTTTNSAGYSLMAFAHTPESVRSLGQPDGMYWQYGQNSNNAIKYGSYSSVTVTGTGTTFVDNTTYGIAWDGDAGELYVYKEGVLATTYANFPAGQHPAFFGGGNNYTQQHLEYGQRGFKHPIAGFEPLSTANMPTPTIANGRDHFQAITGTGANILTAAQAAFPSGLWWIKDRVNANQHQLVDSVRGATKAITTPAHGGEITYVPPAGDSVAWCWNYNAADPSINGFDIVEYTGTGVAQSINHSLGKAPEFFIVQILCNTCNGGNGYWAGVYHEALGPTKALILNTNSAQSTSATWWNNTAPTATQFTVGTQGNVNANGQDVVAYLWTSVPGYSAFGSYTGNYNSDGPFIYTGFKPAFVLTKAVGTGNWVLNDATRNPYNPVDNILYANDTQKDLTPYYDVDFLSNGFKIRSANTYNNPSSAAVVYAAFAENPFQSPVTAR